RPGSVTHHFDTDQRYVELEIQEEGQNHIMFFTPPSPPSAAAPTDSNAAPEGWYMMFLVTNAGVPSVAHWVNLQ
ncbi:MAG: galactose oxidase early set domain-containing protein, partial [Gaiellales bacterium]